MSMDVQTIGSYQLQNLLQNRVPFLLWDLRVDRTHEVAAIAQPTTLERVVGDSLRETPDRQYPILLMCEDGRVSIQAASLLQDAGFINVYILGNGVAGLLGESEV